MVIRTATALINSKALLHNYQTIQNKAKRSKVLAVLKANGYGHGLVRIAKILSQGPTQADAFGVARLDEALALRSSGVTKPIVLLEGFFNVDDIQLLCAHNLQTIIHNEQQLTAILAADLSSPIKVWLKVDTGMHRLGVDALMFSDFYQQLKESHNVHNDVVLMSHLACADNRHDDMTSEQLEVFTELTQDCSDDKSLANSAGICAWPSSHFDWVRPGIMLYGVSPLLSTSAQHLDLIPVMTLQSSIISTRTIAAGESVGYGSAWVSDKQTCIAVIAIGYGDGYPRHAANGTPVLINGRKVPLVGRVSMDMITVDLGANAQETIGDIATLWGDDLPVEEVAEYASTIAYELLCNIAQRVKMIVT